MPGRSMYIRSGQVEVDLELGEGKPIECMCPNDEGSYTWTRKLAAVPVAGEVRMEGAANSLRRSGSRTTRPGITAGTRSGSGRRASAIYINRRYFDL